MCNLYAMMRGRAEVAALLRALDRNNNQPPMSGVYPDYAAPVIVQDPTGAREMRDMRWGMPTPKNVLMDATKKRADKLRAKGTAFDFNELLRLEPDKGVTNIRNTASRHWQTWLEPGHRCLVPFTSFSEPDQVGGTFKQVWYAFAPERPLAFFAGVWTAHGCVRKIKTGWEDCEVFGFLTTEANAEVARHHDKAMPVILTEPADWDLWLSGAPWSEVRRLQQPLPDGALQIVNHGVKEDEVVPA
ncbi:MAG: SOS response-associated peptidase family protein [Phenylobacterium sp.]|uniref:SOS response-associated peptidase n=1 Tax=Phenylobacterium sp. TaxID=1871053 RepID=UPI001A63AE8F|nr:SOS response-associated peptidase family protein [Phenylobacterium sp.]MBL8772215.1 SOS response-associated peptidase family protein [Phenylobacterium sp.]